MNKKSVLVSAAVVSLTVLGVNFSKKLKYKKEEQDKDINNEKSILQEEAQDMEAESGSDGVKVRDNKVHNSLVNICLNFKIF